jgi:signal transduction histidine kinase
MKDDNKTKVQLIREMVTSRKQRMEKLNRDIEKLVVERTQKIQKAYEELRELDKRRDDFLSSISRELRTPLTCIRSFAEILECYPAEPLDVRKEFYVIIRKESERLTGLIDNLLDLSKIRSGKIEWRFKKVEPGILIKRSVETIGCLLQNRDICLDCEIKETLPKITADEDKILQVLMNLLGNAAKFTPKGGNIKVVADLLEGKRNEDRKDLIHISVSDTGIGIPPEELGRIFDYYMQCRETLPDTPKGTGLGLFICKEIVSCHRGNIWVESQKGSGSTFHVTLPVELPGMIQDEHN